MALSKIGTNSISDDAITTAKLPNDAVTSAKIADNTIATTNMADDAVTSAKIADGTIATANMADDAVTSAKIADGTIATANIADDAVGNTKLDLSANYAFTGTITGAGTRKLMRTITITSDTASVEFIDGANGVDLGTTYSRHEITVDSAVAKTDGQQINVYLSSNGGSSYHGDSAYNSTYHRHFSNGSSTGNDHAYVNDFALNHDQGTHATINRGGVTGTIIVDNLGVAHRTVFNGQFFGYGASGYYIHTNSIGTVESNGDTFNAIKIRFRSGDIQRGVFKIYGVL